MDSPTDRLLTDFVMMVGLLRRDMKKNNDFDRYDGRFARIEQKFATLAEVISRENPELARTLHTAFQQPARALAFKNAEHQKKLKDEKSSGTGNPEDN
jgi:hypothetical protein